jgi:DHA3 family macrolide efflux protein-like MFS transporter
MLLFVKIAHIKQEHTGERGAFLADLTAGVSYAAHDRTVRRILLTYGAFIFLCVPSGFLAVLMIKRTFGDSYVYLTVN